MKFKMTFLLTLIIVFSAVASVFAAPQNVNELEKISYDVSGNGLVHGIVDKKELADQSAKPAENLNSRKAIMKEINEAALSPVLNNSGTEKAHSVMVVDGVITLGTAISAPAESAI